MAMLISVFVLIASCICKTQLTFFIDSDTAGMVCGRVYITMRCTFVCPIVWLPYTTAPGLLLWAQRAGDIDRQQRLQRARSSSGATA